MRFPHNFFQSNRKLVMTKNQMHQGLLTQEEYTRSRHTGSEMNNDAEVYVVSSPEINAPGGLAV